MKLIVLAAGATNTTDAYADPPPKCLRRFDESSTVLDRIVAAGRAAGCSQVAVVGGYQILSIMQAYPAFKYYYNPAWQRSGSLASLVQAQGELTQDALIAYSDVVFDPERTAHLAAAHGELVVATDSSWATRYEGRTAALRSEAEKLYRAPDGRIRVTRERLDSAAAWELRGEFAGILALRSGRVARAMDLAREILADDPRAGIDRLISALSADLPPGASGTVDFEGGWAELDSEQDLARFRFGTKAETLERLRGRLSGARILPQYTVRLGAWRTDREECLSAVADAFPGGRVVVRSSALNEDTEHASLAGNYESVLDVPVNDRETLAAAIDAVATSYSKGADVVSGSAPGLPSVDPANQILIQPMLSGVTLSGVAFTADLESGAPYYIINYDTSGSTESITSGAGGDHRTLVLYKHGDATPGDPELAAVVTALREIEAQTGYTSLDIEFAVRRGENDAVEVVIFQVRPIAAHKDQLRVSAADVGHELAHVARFLQLDRRDRSALAGGRTAWGVMPDWNPAEIIGINPRPLAFSLYRHVITDEIWGRSREECGYRATRPRPGIVDLAGKPYVDIRMSFSSFTPAEVPEETADRLVEAAVAHLVANPNLHDKVEFLVMPTAFDLDFDERLAHILGPAGFGEAEREAIHEAYRSLTVAIITGTSISVESELARLARLDERREAVLSALQREEIAPPAALAVLLDDCREYGTLPFSNLARFAFVGVIQLRSLVARGLLSQDRVDQFLASIETVAKEFVRDLATLERNELVHRYGHLRPGTYDITSPAYHEAFDRYVDLDHRPEPEALPRFELTPEEERLIDAELAAAGFVRSADGAASAADAGPANARERVPAAASRAANTAGGASARPVVPVTARELLAFIRAAVQGREAGKFAFTRNLSAGMDIIVAIAASEGLSREEASFLTVDEVLALSGASRPAGLASVWSTTVERRRRRHLVTTAIRMPPVITDAGDIECFTIADESPNFVTQGVVEGRPHRIHGVDPGIAGAIVLIENADPGFDWIFSHEIAALVTRFGGANSHMAIRCAEFGIPAAIGCGEAIFARLEKAHLARLDCGGRTIEVIR